MSAGPFNDRGTADVESENLNQYLADSGFSNTLVQFLKFLLSLPNRPDQPTLVLLERLGIPFQHVDSAAMMAILRGTRQELSQAAELNRKLRIRHDKLYEMLNKDVQEGSGDDLE